MYAFDDTEFPAPTLVGFDALPVGEFARRDANLIRKINGSQAIDLTANAIVAMSSEEVQRVDVRIVELAPGTLS